MVSRKAVFLVGSARSDGFTEKMIKETEKAFVDSGFETTVFYPSEMEINYCNSCATCKDGSCVFDDDMTKIYDAVESCDVLILSSPVQFNSPSAVIKTPVDRFQKYWNSKIEGKKLVGMISIGGRVKPNFEGIESFGKSVALALDSEWVGMLTLAGTDGIDSLSEDDISRAYAFGKEISIKSLSR